MKLVHCYLPVFRGIIFGATFDATGESTRERRVDKGRQEEEGGTKRKKKEAAVGGVGQAAPCVKRASR